ncbi:hypothetical protein GCM10010377_29980 [Streptomyces viridiviolaceus]|nr:hypothetical protein GCM10010377_29980 [Streptomyces viridiviolaceus]
MPGLLVAAVSCGAQVMTVIGSSPEPPVPPGTIPQPTASDAHATSAPAPSAVRVVRERPGRPLREVLRLRRLPVMYPHDSLTRLTRE